MNRTSRLLVTFIPSGSVLKAVVAGTSTLADALNVIDQVAIEAHEQGLQRVLLTLKLVDSQLQPAEYASMAHHASLRLQESRCAILVGAKRRAGAEEVRLLTPNFRIFVDEDRALRWLES
jgi:hypothetical protein